MYTPTHSHMYIVYKIFLRVMKIPENAMPGWLPPARGNKDKSGTTEQTLQKQNTVPLSRGLLHCQPKDLIVGIQKPVGKYSFLSKSLLHKLETVRTKTDKCTPMIWTEMLNYLHSKYSKSKKHEPLHTRSLCCVHLKLRDSNEYRMWSLQFNTLLSPSLLAATFQTSTERTPWLNLKSSTIHGQLKMDNNIGA